MIFPRLSGGFSQDFTTYFMIFPGIPNLSLSTRLFFHRSGAGILMGAPPKGDGTVTAGEPATWIQCSMQKL